MIKKEPLLGFRSRCGDFCRCGKIALFFFVQMIHGPSRVLSNNGILVRSQSFQIGKIFFAPAVTHRHGNVAQKPLMLRT